MSEIDYEELFRSPLDDPESAGTNGWMPAGGGLLAGVAIVLLAGALWGGSDVGTESVVTSTSLTASPASVAEEPSRYPAGYQEYVPGLGIRVGEVIEGDEVITVAFTTAMERGSDPFDELWPVGGTWWLETSDGSSAESSRVVLARYSPGAFSVEFPAGAFSDSSAFAMVSMIERWDHPSAAGSSSVPFSGEPYVMPEPLVISISSGASLILEEMELGRFLGKAVWAIQGDGEPLARVIISAVLLDADGNRIGSYQSFPEILEPAAGGVLEILWAEPFPTSQEGAMTVEVEYEVGIVESVPADLSIDLGQVPIGR